MKRAYQDAWERGNGEGAGAHILPCSPASASASCPTRGSWSRLRVSPTSPPPRIDRAGTPPPSHRRPDHQKRPVVGRREGAAAGTVTRSMPAQDSARTRPNARGGRSVAKGRARRRCARRRVRRHRHQPALHGADGLQPGDPHPVAVTTRQRVRDRLADLLVGDDHRHRHLRAARDARGQRRRGRHHGPDHADPPPATVGRRRGRRSRWRRSGSSAPRCSSATA